MKEAGQRASRHHCVIYYITARKALTPRIRRMTKKKHRAHHTPDLTVLTLKTEVIERVRSLATAKKLLNRLRWVENNKKFSSKPLEFPREKQEAQASSSVQDAETYCRRIYGFESLGSEGDRALADFETNCAKN